MGERGAKMPEKKRKLFIKIYSDQSVYVGMCEVLYLDVGHDVDRVLRGGGINTLPDLKWKIVGER